MDIQKAAGMAKFPKSQKMIYLRETFRAIGTGIIIYILISYLHYLAVTP